MRLISTRIVDVETGPIFCVPEHPLSFREELQNQQVEEGETAFLRCELSKPGVLVQWKKGGVLLRPGNKYKMKQDGREVQLQIDDLEVQDSGIYRCCVDSIETKASLSVKGIRHNVSSVFNDQKCFLLMTSKLKPPVSRTTSVLS